MIHGYGQLYSLHKKQMFTQTLQQIGSMKDELGGLEDDDDENKKKKHQKKSVKT